jgi:hypothetical protein
MMKEATKQRWRIVQKGLGILDDGVPGDQTAGAVASVLGIRLDEPAAVVKPSDTGGLETIHLPDEAVPGQVAAYYGEPSRDPGYLEWFNFPTDQMRLYDRYGPGLSDHDGDDFDDHKCHEMVAGRLEKAFAQLWEDRGGDRFFAEGWHVYAGCYNYRRKKAGSGHSIHSWGAAIDLTAWGSGLLTTECGFSPEGVAIMESNGFLWGPRAWGLPGEYANPKYPGKYFDAMHFQAAIPYLNGNSYYAREGLPENIKRWKP